MSTETEERPRIYLNSVHLKGFKSIEDLTIDLKKGLNILIGKNGAGKSNFMEFIYQSIDFRIKPKVLHKYAELKFISEDNHSFEFETEREINVKIKEDFLSDRIGLTERLIRDGQVIYDESTDQIDFDDNLFTFKGPPRGFFKIWTHHYVSRTYIRYNTPDNLEFINHSGELKAEIQDQLFFWNFPKTLSFFNKIFIEIETVYFEESKHNLKKIDEVEILDYLKIPNKIIDCLKSYTAIEDVRFNKSINLYKEEKALIIDNVRIEFKTNGNWLPWSQLSDGTKRLFYIIAEMSNATGLVLIEEPELGIHPHQFNLLMDFLKEQSEDKQIIISTHSPKALDHLSPDELDHILIAYYDLEKGTQIRHLSDKEITKAQKYMKEVGFFSDYWMLSDME